MDPSEHHAVDTWLRRDRDRPLAEVIRPSNRIGATVSEGLQAAGTNLLDKALAAVVAGDQDRARRYVERAVRLPFDEHEQVGTAWWAASMLMYTVVDEELEACDPGDDSWLTAAESVLVDTEQLVAQALQGTLVSVTESYQLSRRERERCRVATRGCDANSWAVQEPAGEAERVAAVLGVVELAAAYIAALEAARPVG
jgi:hypothetical protein